MDSKYIYGISKENKLIIFSSFSDFIYEPNAIETKILQLEITKNGYLILLDENYEIFEINEEISTIKMYEKNSLTFNKLNFNTKIVCISCGDFHFLFLDEFGCVFSKGCNDVGQLGLGHFTDVQNAIEIYYLPVIIEIFCSTFTSLVIDCNRSFWYFGKLKGKKNCLPIKDSRNNLDITSFISDGVVQLKNGDFLNLNDQEIDNYPPPPDPIEHTSCIIQRNKHSYVSINNNFIDLQIKKICSIFTFHHTILDGGSIMAFYDKILTTMK